MYTIREARPSDNDALIALDLRCPLELGDVELVMDRRPDFFAHARLQEHPLLLVAEDGGEIIGVIAGAWHDVPALGKTRRLLYFHHVRILPSYQRRGIGRVLGVQLAVRFGGLGIESPYWFTVPSNTGSMSFAQAAGTQPWPVPGRLCSLDGEAAALSPRVHRLGPERADDAATLINETHRGMEFFPTYTAQRLSERLARSPHYAWDDYYGLFEGDRLLAVAGLWDQGRSLAFLRRDRRDGSATVSRSMAVVDYGFAAGAQRAMVELLRHLAALAVRRGRTGLSLGLPPPGSMDSLLPDLSHSIDDFCCFAPGLPQPEPGRIKGVHLDPFYL